MGFRGNQNYYDILNQCALYGGSDGQSSGVPSYNPMAKDVSGDYMSIQYSNKFYSIFYLMADSYAIINASSTTESNFNFTGYTSTAITNTSTTKVFSYNTAGGVRTLSVNVSISNSGNESVTVNSLDFLICTYILSSPHNVLIGTYFLDTPITISAGGSVTKVLDFTTTLPTTDPALVG